MSILAKQKSYKIVFGSGLTNTGVSTLLRAFLEWPKWTPSRDDAYHATIDFERKEINYVNSQFVIFDLENHTAFLDRWVGELSEYMFSGVNVLVFIVDPIEIRDLKRVRYYFEKMKDHLDTYSPSAKIFVFLHKWDLVPSNLTGELYNEIRSFLFANLDPSFLEAQIRVYKTSVFTRPLTSPMLDVFITALTGEFL